MRRPLMEAQPPITSYIAWHGCSWLGKTTGGADSPRGRRDRMRAATLGIAVLLVLCQPWADAFAFTPCDRRRWHGQDRMFDRPRRLRPLLLSTASSIPSNSNADGDSYRQVVGNWEELHGNFLLRPSVEAGPPRALIHFLGGAIVGASPHIAYRYLLERLADKGYLIVATPYDLSFDHLQTCDAVISGFERIAALLAQTYGALPVVGVGHSCGALLQLLITSLFPDTPRAANALISFNNKPVSDAIPFFEEFFAPFFTYAAAANDPNRQSGSEIIAVGLRMAKAAATGRVPSDELLSRAAELLLPPVAVRLGKDGGEGGGDRRTRVAVPAQVRDLFESLAAPVATTLSETQILPVVAETFDALQQIPMLIDEVALDGARDFVPPPDLVKSMTRRAYRARKTLIVKYTEDSFDESDELDELLKAAGQVIRNKRPMIQIDVQKRELSGGHATPLLAPPLDLASRAERVLGADVAKESLRYAEADRTVEELSRWLDESNL